jgi:surface antigen
VSYAAYRLKKNGVLDPWVSPAPDASKWDEAARAAGVRVDHVPAVGAIAQWDVGTYGHVAYVERVTAQYIEISEDSYVNDSSGVSSVRRLSRTGRDFATADFLHFDDVKPAHG